MYFVNVPKIRGKMGEKGYTITSLAAKIGVNRNTLAGYLENPTNIPYCKLAMLAEALCDDPIESAHIFLLLTYAKRKFPRNQKQEVKTNMIKPILNDAQRKLVAEAILHGAPILIDGDRSKATGKSTLCGAIRTIIPVK